MSTRNHADPITKLLDIIDERAKSARPAEPILGTITSTNPLTVELDTGQIIVNPVVVGPTEA